MSFELRFTIPGQIPRAVPLDQPRMIIGTLLSNHVVIRAPGVDPIHAMLEVQPDGAWVLTDLGSEMGTKVNGISIDVEAKVREGDKITIGSLAIDFQKREEVSGIPTPPGMTPPPPSDAKHASTKVASMAEKPTAPAAERASAVAAPTVKSERPETQADEKRAEEKKDLLFSPRDARPSGDVLEVVAYWGETVLDVDLFHPKIKNYDRVTIGDPTKANFIAAGKENLVSYPLAKVKYDGYTIKLNSEMQARLRRKGRVEKVDEATSIELDKHDIAHIKLGPVRYFMCFVRPPALEMPRTGPADPFILWLSIVSAIIYLIAIPALWMSTPKPKEEDPNEIYQIVQSPEELKKPEPEKEKPKPPVKVAEKAEPTPPPVAPPPPKPKPVVPAKVVEKEKVEQPKPVEKPVPVAAPTQSLANKQEAPKAPTPQKTEDSKPAGKPDLSKLNKSTAGMASAEAKKPDFKYAGAPNNKPLGAAGGPKGSGNKQAGGEIKGNKAVSVHGVEGVDNDKPSGVNLSKLGLGVGKVLNKTGAGAIATNFKNSAGGAGGGSGSGAKTYGMGGPGSKGSLGLAGTDGAVQNFGSGAGGFLGGQGGAGGLGGSNGGPGFGSGGGANGKGGHGRANVTIPPGDPGTSGGLTAQEIMAVIRANLNQIRHCYEQLLQRSPNAAGKMAVNWVVATSGSVSSVSVADSSISDSAMRGCVTGRIKSWQFPKPRGGQPVTVNYPFVFNPL